MPSRDKLIRQLVGVILAMRSGHCVRVAVDGVDGVGKTTFADALGSALTGADVPIIRASIDKFHNPRDVRYRQGRHSPGGFYDDSYNLDALKRELLDPLSPGGDCCYRTAVFDHASGHPVHGEATIAKPGSVLVFDGLFLHRRELRDYWDFSIFLDAPFEITVPRGAARGSGWGSPDPAAQSNQRYIEGQKIYFESDQPQLRASVVIDNSDLDNPVILTGRY